MRKIAFALTCLLFSLAVGAQQRTVTGTVTNDSSASPISGATVAVKGTTLMTQTAADGTFTISLPDGKTILAISSVGFEPQEVSVSGQGPVMVTLKPAANRLNEVIVTGYTSQRKQDLTGAVAVVDLAPVKNNSSGNTMQALQGRVAGLYIEKDGSPNGSNGRILIRGANTLGNNDPLYVIDGVPTTRPEVFQNMDPATIASVQVLKDASAASIYGARASNGVIIVTTKKWRQYK